jgi:hypothetical protein
MAKQPDARQTLTNLNKAPTAAPKKHHTGLIIGLSAVAILLILPVLVAAWFGFVPGISRVIGATKAQNLGVVYTPADYASYQQKTAVTFKDYATAPIDPANPGNVTVFADPRTVTDLRISQEELTSAINSSGWVGMPIDNVQVRLTDGTVEISGNLNVANIQNFVNDVNSSNTNQQDINNSLGWAKSFLGNAPVYIKANASIQNSKLTFTVIEAKIGRFSLPIASANSADKSDITLKADNFEAVNVQAVNGALIFTGTYPATLYVKK